MSYLLLLLIKRDLSIGNIFLFICSPLLGNIFPHIWKRDYDVVIITGQRNKLHNNKKQTTLLFTSMLVKKEKLFLIYVFSYVFSSYK